MSVPVLDLEAVRAELPVCRRLAYLNAGTFGPLPRRTADASAGWTARLVEEGRSNRAFFEELLELRERLRAEIGRLLNAPEGSVALTTATTDGCNIVLAGLGIAPGDEVVTTDSEHPGLFGGLLASGADLRIASIRELPAAEALTALEAEITQRTRLVAVSHVSWLTGAVLPIRDLAAHGIPLLVDGAQGAGAIPVDVQELGCDFYTVSAQKWLLGPEATGALYVRPERVDELRMTFPSFISWQFEKFPEYLPREGAARFDPGWIPAGSLAGLQESLAFAAEVGEARFEHALAMAEACRELLVEQGADVVTDPGQATLVSWRADEPQALAARLAERGVVMRDLPGTGLVRASCGFWTSEDDLERLAAGL
jgi:L-cysteine/cystine lyase